MNTVEVYSECPTWTIGNFFGVPVYRMEWFILYRLPNAPSTWPTADNVAEGIVNGQVQATT